MEQNKLYQLYFKLIIKGISSCVWIFSLPRCPDESEPGLCVKV